MEKSIKKIREEMKRYFGGTKFTASFKKEYGLIEVVYYDFRIMEDVSKELSKIAGSGWEVDASCGIPYSEYIGGIVAEIEKKQELLTKRKAYTDLELNVQLYRPLFYAKEYLTSVLMQANLLTANSAMTMTAAV